MFRVVVIVIAREREAVWSSKMVIYNCMNSMFIRRVMIIFVGKRERHLPADRYNQPMLFVYTYIHALGFKFSLLWYYTTCFFILFLPVFFSSSFLDIRPRYEDRTSDDMTL
jgi:hypothetical protein